MAHLTATPALRQFLPGDFEDAFVYMNNLIVVTADREILTVKWDRLVQRSPVGRDDRLLAGLLLLRNDYLAQEGTREVLQQPSFRSAFLSRLSHVDEELLDLDEWDSRLSYEALLGDGALLDLQIYNQRLFAATTHGVVHTNLLFELDDLRFSAPVKRTDARCLALNLRYGTLAASCGADGLLMSFDEFNELSTDGTNHLAVRSDYPSVRTSWLGYHLVNYESATEFEGFRSSYSATKGNHPANIVTGVSSDERLLAVESENVREDLDFRYNAHTTFFSHFRSGEFELYTRRWSNGRLGRVESRADGVLDRPLSTHATLSGFLAETYQTVVQVAGGEVTLLYTGEAIVVRTFPFSQWYRNIILIVAEDGLHIVSPSGALTENVDIRPA